jgi:hypothetical protein
MNEMALNAFGNDSRVEDRLAAAVERSELRSSPFDHIYMEQVLPQTDYNSIVENIPDHRFFHEQRHPDALRADGRSRRLRMYLYPELLWRLPGEQRRIWGPIARALCSRRLEHAFKEKFRSALEDRFGQPLEAIGIFPVPVLLRDQPGYRIGIHSDAANKAITVQFYLPRDNSLQHVGTIFHEGSSGALASRTTQMPFLPATGYAFPVCATKSWHSASATTEWDGERISMMVTYYVTNDAQTRLRFRIRRAALLFGRHPLG